MPATVLDGYASELAQSLPPNYAPNKTNEAHGRVRMAYFSKTFASEASGLDLALAVIPQGARLLGGTITFSASTGSATIALGLMDKAGSGEIAPSVSDGVAVLRAAAAITVTTPVAFGETQALLYGYETQKELYLTLTTGAASMGTQVVKGHILYVVD